MVRAYVAQGSVGVNSTHIALRFPVRFPDCTIEASVHVHVQQQVQGETGRKLFNPQDISSIGLTSFPNEAKQA